MNKPTIKAMRLARKYSNSKMYPMAVTAMRVLYGNLKHDQSSKRLIEYVTSWRKR